MNYYKDRSYHRRHLRAPYKEEVLLKIGKDVYKAQSQNISLGGLSLNHNLQIDVTEFNLLLKLPSFPYFKNFNYQKLISYSQDLLKSKVIKLKCETVRVDNSDHRVGLKTLEVSPFDAELIASYVDVFSSNLIYLQTLIENVNQRPDLEKKIRELARVLGYQPDLKIALLNKIVIHDYRSLQWL